MIVPQVKPAPKPAITIISSLEILLSFTTSFKAKGIEAAEVLPYSLKLEIILSRLIASFSATAIKIRSLA